MYFICRKRKGISSSSPSRKSPRLANLHGGSSTNVGNANSVSVGDGNKKLNARPSRLTASEDGRSSSSAFVLSPTVPKPNAECDDGSISCGSKDSAVSDGKSKRSAILISPTVTKSPPADGKSKRGAIEISPTVTIAQSSSRASGENHCRAIVVSPTVGVNNNGSSGSFPKPWTLSPLVGSKLGNLGVGSGSPSTLTPQIQQLIRNLSETVKKQGLMLRFSQSESSSSAGIGRKRKQRNLGASSSSKPRDNRPGMFTPPGFDLGIESLEEPGIISEDQEVTDSEVDGIGSDEDAAPLLPEFVEPLNWAEPEGIFCSLFSF